MKSFLLILAATATIGRCHRSETVTPGFAVDFRSFFQELPYREQTRTFRETGHGQHHYRGDFRDFRGQFGSRDETRFFSDDLRFKDDSRSFRDESRSFRDDLRPFRDELRPLKDESRSFKDDSRLFKDDSRVFKDDSRSSKDDSRLFRDERNFRDEIRGHRFREEYSRPFREEMRIFRDDIGRPYEQGPRHFKDELKNFRNNEVRAFRDETSVFREERPYGEERPFREEDPLRGNVEHRPFREEARPFKDEMLFTQESQNLAEAHHRFNKEQEHRGPISYDGHSNYLKYGNHGLGYASIPSAILPLQEDPPRLASGLIIPDMTTTTTAATASPGFLSKNGIPPGTSSPGVESAITQSHIAVTLAPEIGSTPSQTSSGNAMNAPHSVNLQPANENLMERGPTSSTTVVTASGTSPSKIMFSSGPSSPMVMGPEGSSGLIGGSTGNSLHPSKQGMSGVATPSSFYRAEGGSPEVPEGILNYVFKYQMPEHEMKMRYAYRNPLQSDSYAGQLPIIQTAKYAIIPELKLFGLDGINRQPTPALNYPAADLAKSYLTASSPSTITLTNPTFSSDNVPTVNFGGNLIQLEQMGNVQSNQYPQLRQTLSTNEYIPQLGQYANLAQPGRQAAGVPFAQGGLQLQLSNFGGLDYNTLTGNPDGSRVTPSMNLGLGETSGSPGSSFAKISFGEQLWQL